MSTLLTAQSLHVDTAFGTLFDDLTFTLKKAIAWGLSATTAAAKARCYKFSTARLPPLAGLWRWQITVILPVSNNICLMRSCR